MTTQKTPGKRILSVLLCIMMLLPMLPATALAAYVDKIHFIPSGGGNAIEVQGGGCWKNDGTEVSTGSYNIKYDADKKTLTLNDYNAGSIDTERMNSSCLTINVSGNNTINGYIEKNCGTLNLAFSEGSTLTINAGDKQEGIFINQTSGEPATLNINGKGTLTINAQTTEAGNAVYGIHASGTGSVDNTVNIENMTVSINCQSSNGSTYGIFAKNIIIDESNVTIDARQSAGNTGSSSYGVYAGSETKITGNSDVKTYWNPNGTNGEGLSRFTPDACTAVNGIAGYAHYRRSPAGAGSVTVTGGKAAVENGIPNKETAQFLTGDTVTLIPNEDLKNYYSFKEWSIGKSTFVGNSFTMPNERDVKVQAYYKAFSQQPQFNYDSKSGECSVTFTYKAAKDGWSYYPLCFYKVNDDGSLTKSRVLYNSSTPTGTYLKLTEKITDITDTGLYGLENGTYRVGIPMNNGPVGNFVLYSDTFEVKVPQKLSAPTLWVDGVKLTGTDKTATAPLLDCWQALQIDVTDIPEGAAVMFRVVGATPDSNRFDLPSYGNRSQADNNTTITVTPVSGFPQAHIAVQAMKNIPGGAPVWSEPVYVAAHFVNESELPDVTVNVTAEGQPVTDTTGTIKFTNNATIKATVGTTEPKIWGLELVYRLNKDELKLFPDEGLTYDSDTYSAFVNVFLVPKWDRFSAMGRAQMIHLENTVAQKYTIQGASCSAYNAAGEEITMAAEGETVTVKATGPHPERFAGWECFNATVVDEKAPETTFTMPDKAVTIDAVYFNEIVKEVIERRYEFHPNWLQAAALGTGSIAADAVISSYEKKITNPVTITQVWYEGDAAGGTPVETLSADRNYTGIITLSIPAACSFATDFEKSIKVRDASGNVFPVGTSNIQYTNGEKSMTITLHLVNKPTVTLNHYVGQNYSTSSTGSYPAITGHAGYSVTTLNYETGGTGKIASSASSMTISKLVLTCTDGAYLLPGSQVWVNGKAAAATSAVASSTKTLTTTSEVTLPITSPSSITAANAIVTPPAAGQRPSFTAISAEPDKYKVELQYWVDDKGGIIDLSAINNDIRPDYFNYKFIGGDKYQVYVKFTAVTGAGGFAENATFTINGQPASKPSGGSGLLHYCEFIATGTGGGTEPITYSATVGDVDLGTAKVGYKQSDIPTQYVAITNTGTGSLYTNFSSVKLTGAGAGNFELPQNSSTPNKIAAGASASSGWYIKPKEGLGIGTYTATIQFKDKDGKVTATGTVIFTVEDHEFDTTQWKSDPTNHWNPCKDDGCTVRGNEAAHDKEVTKGYKEPTFDKDGYTGDKYCSVCDRKMEAGKAIAAGKYIRKSKATMAPAAIHAGICANDIVFTSLEPSKYTVTLKRVYDLTDGNLNTDSNQYPRNKNFIEGHEYRIDFSFAPVGSYVYNTDDEIHWSTFTLNDEAVDTITGTYLSGSTDRMIKLTAGAPPTGVSVGGTAVSWNENADAQYYLYPATMEDKDIRAQWKTGATVSGYVFTGTGGGDTVSTTVDGRNMYSQTFSFSGVTAGEYKLVIFKPGKYVPKIVPITVNTSDYDCGQQKLWLYGDVTGDGKIRAGDATQILKYTSYKRVFSEEEMLAADVNKDGKVKAGDATQILKYTSYKASAFDNMP